MIQVEGIPILADVAIGKLKLYQTSQPVSKEGVGEEEERARLDRAFRDTAARLAQLHEKTVREAGEDEAAILEIHQMLLEDEDFKDTIEELLQEGCSAEYAVRQAGEGIAEVFRSMDAYMQARSADIRDVANQLINALTGREEVSLSEPVILMADDLAPSATVQLDKTMLLGFVTREGSTNSHTAILARTMNIPALIQTPICPEWEGKLAAIDGSRGVLYVDPDQETLERMTRLQEENLHRRRQLEAFRDKKAVTKDGREILTFANAGSLDDVALALENGAEGIGLFRSEFLYLGRESFPTEEEQFQIYRTLLERMGERKVIVRTMDIGADKKVDYFHLDEEENPALGYRAIRICLDRKEIFHTQLRALLRAAVYGNLSIMYPMIISLGEVLEIKATVAEVYQQLRDAHVACAMPEQGIMIETPAAAIISDQLAEHVDFFSIGTNDLTQYTLAVDRQNAKLARYCDTHHPAVLQLIQTVVKAGHRAGILVGICGELGGDFTLTRKFLEMGVDELSVNPGVICDLRQHVRNMDLREL